MVLHSTAGRKPKFTHELKHAAFVEATASHRLSRVSACNHHLKQKTTPDPSRRKPRRSLPGTYSLEGALVCSPCPSGFYSGDRAETCIPCEAGTYRQEDSPVGYCYNCAAGTYAPFDQASECMDCPRGFYSLAGSTGCTPCPAGTAAASVATGPACLSCFAGEYSSEVGSAECERCPAGTASANVGANSDSACQVRRRTGSGCVWSSRYKRNACVLSQFRVFRLRLRHVLAFVWVGLEAGGQKGFARTTMLELSPPSDRRDLELRKVVPLISEYFLPRVHSTLDELYSWLRPSVGICADGESNDGS